MICMRLQWASTASLILELRVNYAEYGCIRTQVLTFKDRGVIGAVTNHTVLPIANRSTTGRSDDHG